MSEKKERVWILGGKASGADKNIPWQENIPNLSNSDKLIIDLNTIPSQVQVPLKEVNTSLRYMMMGHKSIYVILPHSYKVFNHLTSMFPVLPRLIEIKPCDFDRINLMQIRKNPDEILEYCKHVENCSFFIDQIFPDVLWKFLYPKSDWTVERYPFSDEIASMGQNNLFEILNVSCQAIGWSVNYEILNKDGLVLHRTGAITFLPPPTRITSNEAVDILVNSLVGMEFTEEQPEWVLNEYLPNIDKLANKIQNEQKIVKVIEKKIIQLKTEKAEIEKHRRLLWTYDKPLEKAVKDAFTLLGFEEIRDGRSKELEDWVIDFKTDNKFVHGVLEVKGSLKRTSLENMNQCFKWVNQYRVQEKKKVKGIFLPNQFRRLEKLMSKKRLQFEPNEIEFAKDFDICVLPTSELFKAVVHILEGKRLSRNEVEKRILEANPICKLIE